MPKCSRCGIPVVTGQYFIDNEKVVCYACESHIPIKKEKPKNISCLYCDNVYDINLRRCPKCNEYNAINDFHFAEFTINVGIGLISIAIPLFLLLMVFRGPAFGMGIVLSPIFFIEAFLVALVYGILFYLGRWVRDMVFGRTKKQK